jgi:hypothetical protein
LGGEQVNYLTVLASESNQVVFFDLEGDIKLPRVLLDLIYRQRGLLKLKIAHVFDFSFRILVVESEAIRDLVVAGADA